MSEHVEASEHKQHAELHQSQNAVGTQARRVDATVPRIDPSKEANLPSDPKDYKDEQEDSILPDQAQGFLDKLGRGARKARGATLEALPTFMVNNSSNIIGATHMGGEVMMIKAYSPIKTAEDIAAMQGKNRTVEEIKYFLKGIPASLPLRMKVSDLVNPKFHVDNFRALTDLNFATERDLQLGKISNRWGMRSTILGMSGMALSAVLPEKAETNEEIQEMAQLREDNYLGYMGARLSQAVNPLQWSSHKRQLAGMGLVGGGACSFMNGMMSATQGAYTRNFSHAAGGAITLVAGGLLMLAADNEQGWQNFGKTMSLRMLFLPTSISRKYGVGKDSNGLPLKPQDGRHWYVGGQVAFRGTDATAYLIGGAEKLPDGTIVDKQAIRKEAELKAKGKPMDTIFDEEKPAPQQTEKAEPTNQVAEISGHSRQEVPEAAVGAHA